MESCTLESTLNDSEYRHGAHCLIWAPWEFQVLGRYQTKAAILLQMRFDGLLGFAGGRVDAKAKSPEVILDALNRELTEEINLDQTRYKVTQDDYLFTDRDVKSKLVYHFYSYRVSMEDIREIERQALTAKDYGDEVFGLLRVPLYTMGDSARGFPTFLKNAFIANAKEQLLRTLALLNIMTKDEIDAAIAKSIAP